MQVNEGGTEATVAYASATTDRKATLLAKVIDSRASGQLCLIAAFAACFGGWRVVDLDYCLVFFEAWGWRRVGKKLW
jgi:hypothetical protein